jgi:putative nucleotidyltransferase with HDIG domain
MTRLDFEQELGPPEARAPCVLVVAAEDPVRTALAGCLVQERFEVHAVATVDEVVATLSLLNPACVIVDEQPPALTAAAVTARIPETPLVPAMLLLASQPAAPGDDLAGVTERLRKPVDPVDLVAALRRLLRRRDAEFEARQLNERLRQEVAIRTAELRQERENLQRLSVAALEALVNALEAKDPHLRGHSGRVADLAGKVAVAYGLPPDRVDAVRTAGRLHDLGKIGVREQVLNKEGPLTREEFEDIKAHPQLGAQILAPLAHLAEVIGYVRHHHERWDGTGYPDGLRGEAIPLGARIIGAVEIFDALTTARPYQETMTPHAAVQRMRELVGSVLDPEVHAALARVIEGEEGT